MDDEAWCLFEELGPALAPYQGQDFATRGTRLAEELVACQVPKLVGSGVDSLNLRLAPGPDPRTKSQTGFLLRVTDQCPSGHACRGAEVVECPPGH